MKCGECVSGSILHILWCILQDNIVNGIIYALVYHFMYCHCSTTDILEIQVTTLSVHVVFVTS